MNHVSESSTGRAETEVGRGSPPVSKGSISVIRDSACSTFSPSVAFVIDIEIADRNNRAAVDRLRLADQTSTMLNTGSTAQPQVVYARLANQCQRSEESITGRNDLKRPFIWTNPAEDILAKTERERKQVRTTAH